MTFYRRRKGDERHLRYFVSGQDGHPYRDPSRAFQQRVKLVAVKISREPLSFAAHVEKKQSSLAFEMNTVFAARICGGIGAAGGRSAAIHAVASQYKLAKIMVRRQLVICYSVDV